MRVSTVAAAMAMATKPAAAAAGVRVWSLRLLVLLCRIRSRLAIRSLLRLEASTA